MIKLRALLPSGPRRVLALLTALILGMPHAAAAQTLNLRDLLTDFLRRGITLAPPPVGTDHSAHFIADESSQFNALRQVNAEIAYQLSTYPLSSSAGGFAYRFDPELGVLSRPTRSFGPVFTERAFNVGKGRLNLGMNYSQFSFDRIDAIDLKDQGLQLVFQHEDVNQDGSNFNLFAEGDLVTSRVLLDIRTTITALVMTYGFTDRLDLGLAVPMVKVSMDLSAESLIDRLATGDTLSGTHAFANGTSRESIRESGEASGLGDVRFRAKYRLAENGRAMAALLGEATLPTGDERNLLGTGQAAGKLSFVGTWNAPTVAPHVNVGYGVAGGSLPNEFTYSLGIDCAVDPRVTVSGDLLGRSLTNVRSVQVEDRSYSANTNPDPSQPPDVVTETRPTLTYTPGSSRTTIEAALGFKLNVVGNLLLTGEGLFPLTDKGLRDEFTGLIGLDYSF